MNVVVYLRVSTDRQAEEGLGLEVQEQAIRAWAREHRHRVVLWARDEGVSGSNGFDSRTGLADALEALRSHQSGGPVVYRLDRLARDLVLQEQLLADIRRIGGDVYSTSSAEASYLTDDPEDPSRKLIRQVLGAVNEYERAMIALRLRSDGDASTPTAGTRTARHPSATASMAVSSSPTNENSSRERECMRSGPKARRTDRSPRLSRQKATNPSAAACGTQ